MRGSARGQMQECAAGKFHGCRLKMTKLHHGRYCVEEGRKGLLSSAGSTSDLETNEIEVARFSKDRASDGRSRFLLFRSVDYSDGLLEIISNQPVLDAQTSTKIIDKTGDFCQETAP